MAESAEYSGDASTTPKAPPRRYAWLRWTLIALPLVALAAAWAITLTSQPVDRSDPAAVAEHFLTAVQANHPNQAYALTSKGYRQAISKDDFANKLVSDLSQTTPHSKPALFNQSNPPNGDKNQVQVIYNIPADGQADDHRAAIFVVRENSAWAVEGFTIGPGKATPETTGASNAAQ
jgi:hypothetical protein